VSRVDLDAVEAVINRPHVINLTDDGFTIMHPPACHPDLFACTIYQAAQHALTEPPPELGRFFCELGSDGQFAIGAPATDSQGIDWAALVRELRALYAAVEGVNQHLRRLPWTPDGCDLSDVTLWDDRQAWDARQAIEGAAAALNPWVGGDGP
jgi:hypothetical protein